MVVRDCLPPFDLDAIDANGFNALKLIGTSHGKEFVVQVAWGFFVSSFEMKWFSKTKNII